MRNYKAGKYINQGTYKSFEPEKINREWELSNMNLINLLSQADRQLGRLDMYSEYIPNIELFITMHVAKEATQSSRIEGTKTNIEEALLSEENISEEKRDDWEEVQNYIIALNSAIEELEKLPFSSRLIKNTHRTLLQGVRGKNKIPGEYRKSQNWIGGASIQDAIFVPPIHNSINELMGDLENFAHNEEFKFPDLLKAALIHYQFETIHPFLDGNGRVGRLMITLFLVEKGLLKRPVLYLSNFFAQNKTLYYDNLMYTREKNDLTQWFKFFLVGVIETAKSSIRTFDGILKLEKEVNQRINSLGVRTENAHKVVRKLYQHPIIEVSYVSKITGLSLVSSYKLIDELERLDILEEITGYKKGKIYLFREYFDLFK